MRRTTASLALYVALVFAGGIAVGVLGQQYFDKRVAANERSRPRNPEEYRARYLQDMRSRLKLSDSQVAELEKILDETRNKFRAVREKYGPEMKAIQDEQTERINAILNADQQTEYALMRKERDERRKAMEKQGRIPPAPR
jgi:hypothetical protein